MGKERKAKLRACLELLLDAEEQQDVERQTTPMHNDGYTSLALTQNKASR
jgi:hypothetical protein